MDAKSVPLDQSEKLSELNKKILEVKKKIQLSEGQRKAVFGECETEMKTNGDEILKLKKEISELSVKLHGNKNPDAKRTIKDKELERIVGPLGGKSGVEVEELLDLQIIDRRKQIDLLKYRTKLRKKYLAELAAKYQKLLTRQEQKELDKNVEAPIKKKTCELQNDIHSVEVKIREAVHVQNRYIDIQKCLKEDSDNFGCNIKKLEEELGAQRVDVEKLQKIVDEAGRMRASARHSLFLEERAANAAAAQREKEANEGRRLVNERKIELERLEKRIFQTGKLPSRPEPEGAEESPGDNKPTKPTHPVELIAREFEVLKKATGGTSTEEILSRFQTQKDTQDRLNLLRNRTEEEKSKLEKKLESVVNKFESYKYSEFKDAESNRGEVTRMQEEIDVDKEACNACHVEAKKNESALESLLEDLRHLQLCINPDSSPQKNCSDMLAMIEEELTDLLGRVRRVEGTENDERNGCVSYTWQYSVHLSVVDKLTLKGVEEHYYRFQWYNQNVSDEKWLPGPYNSLVRRTPIPQPGASPIPPPPPGSEDEEEVPSRGYLKRQAQLVVDAKSRRKNIRIQLPRRN